MFFFCLGHFSALPTQFARPTDTGYLCMYRRRPLPFVLSTSSWSGENVARHIKTAWRRPCAVSLVAARLPLLPSRQKINKSICITILTTHTERPAEMPVVLRSEGLFFFRIAKSPTHRITFSTRTRDLINDKKNIILKYNITILRVLVLTDHSLSQYY